jgi:hypothetical protein
MHRVQGEGIIRAITICNPYPSLIFLPESDPRHKRVENRHYSLGSFTGPLLIHAGKSREFLDDVDSFYYDPNYGIPESEMVFGAIVGVVELAGTVALLQGGKVPEAARHRWPWLETHRHKEGPYCLILENPRKFAKPIPYRGMQGLYSIPDDVHTFNAKATLRPTTLVRDSILNLPPA